MSRKSTVVAIRIVRAPVPSGTEVYEVPLLEQACPHQRFNGY